MTLKWISRSVKVGLPSGLHARTSMTLIDIARGFQGKLAIEKNGSRLDASSILNILSLGIETGQVVTLHATDDGEELLETLCLWLESSEETSD